MTSPPTRFAARVTSHRRTSCGHEPRPAIRAVTGTRKFSVNSSLRASSNAMNPIENAAAASSGCPVSWYTTR
jgi:hypothetical protein